MTIGIVSEKVKLSDKFRARIVNKLALPLERHLTHLEEDLKKSTLVINKLARGGYEVKFDMKLPFVHVYSRNVGKNLLNCVLRVRDESRRIIRKNLDKLKERR